MDLSVVIPCFNESDNLEKLALEIREHCLHFEILVEVIFVDDGSTDDTWHVIKNVCQKSDAHTLFRGLRLANNTGQQNAIIAGYSASKGDYVLSMDGDGQHPVEKIIDFWKARSKDKIIVGTLRSRQGNWHTSLLSKWFYQVFRLLSGYNVIDSGGDFRLIPREILELLLVRAPNNGVIRFLISEYKLKIFKIEFDAKPRLNGRARYTLGKRIKLALNSFTTSVNLMLRGVATLIFMSATVGTITISHVLVTYYSGRAIQGWSSTLLLISVFSLLQTIGIYLVLQVQRRILDATQGVKPFVVIDRI